MADDVMARILSDPELAVDIRRRLPAGLDGAPRARAASPVAVASRAPSEAGLPVLAGDGASRAIVRRIGRPTLLVRNGTFELPTADTWYARLMPTKSRLDAAIRSVGRLEVRHHDLPFVGTGWMVGPDVAITNRHVALAFVRRRGAELAVGTSPSGARYQARLDFNEELLAAEPFEVRVTKVLFVAELADDAPDVALLRVAPVGERPLPPPLPLFAGDPRPGQVVVAIGYPARDDRNGAEDQDRLFEGRFDVKRLAPGEVVALAARGTFTHDCTTLGGSSGSPVVDVETGAVVGLHFAGAHLEANHAVGAPVLHRLLRRVGQLERVTVVAPPGPPPAMPVEEGRAPRADELAGRDGYRADFLGDGALAVPLPRLGAALAAEAVVVDARARGTNRFMLTYRHFSIAMHARRRLAIFTATNIDGAAAVPIKRNRNPWAFDPRIPRTVQVGAELYRDNDFDRGHLTRRLDPAWGPNAVEAEADTFFYTNSTPQHLEFNQHLWERLESYLLDNAQTRGFSASVFTGPVLSDTDRTYRGVAIPQSFWKVAVMVHDDTGRLSATAYLVSQADLITGAEFVFGQFKTYQLPLADVERLTGLDFGRLRRSDPLRARGEGARELRRPEDLTLGEVGR